MACLDHACCDCDWWDASNERVYDCPECGGQVVSRFDEVDDFRIEYEIELID